MKLNIAQNLRKYRKNLGITQEALASALGVSAQCVSKWECDDGYPDMEMLPEIADFFKITVDELIGTHTEASAEEICQFVDTYAKMRDSLKRVKYCEDYARRFPGDFKIAETLISAIMELKEDEREAYLPLLREICEKIINECPIQWMRERAVEYMCIVCDDEEYNSWEQKCASGYDSYWSEILEKRLWSRNRKDESRVRHGVNNFQLLCYFFLRNNRDGDDPSRAVHWQKSRMRLIEFLGIPDCWRGLYARSAMEAACVLFRCGEKEEGYAYLEQAFEQYEIWNAIPPGTELDVGDSMLFGGIHVLKAKDGEIEWNLLLPGGTKEHFNDAFIYGLPEKRDLFNMLTYWRGLDNIRNEDRFKQYAARAKEMAEAE